MVNFLKILPFTLIFIFLANHSVFGAFPYEGQYSGEYGGQYFTQYDNQYGDEYFTEGPYPAQYGSQYFGQYTSEYSTQYSTQYTSQYTSQYSTQYTSQYTSQYSTQYTSQYSSQYSSQAPPPPPQCPGSGIPQSGWGGSCSPEGTGTKLACNGPGHCSVAGCTRYSNGALCWYNSGVCYNDPASCSSVYNSYTQQNQTCQNGTWVTTSSACVASCRPARCNQGRSCGSCGVVCGNGVRQCNYTRDENGQACSAPAGTEPCSQICPPGNSCVAQACVQNSTIAGNVFVDTNVNGLKDAGEVNYTGSITMTSTGGTVSSGGGAYTVSNLLGGQYTVSYTSLPPGYLMTYPQNGPPPSFTVTVGSFCNTGGSNSATCSGGSIINLNFGINNAQPWIQGIGASLRLDRGFTSRIPTSNATCGGYASLPGSGGTPGIIFSGESTPDFGQGGASQEPYNWVVGGTTYPETYAPTRIGGIVKTSYSYVLARAAQGTITVNDLAPYCAGGISNCSLSGSLPRGVYRANGNLRLVGGSYTFLANSNYVILVNGDLTIATKIFVPTNSTATFSSSRDILIETSIGETSFTSTASSIEGIYSADRSFIVQGVNNCSTGTDLRFNVGGSVIANAALTSGSFQNLRNLCAGNAQCPAFSVKERPDFILNTPDFLKQPNFTYQETAP